MYDTYIFDLYGTLVDIHTDEEDCLFWEKMCGFFAFYGVDYKAKELQNAYLKLVSNAEERLVKEAINSRQKEEISVEIDIAKVIRDLYLQKGFREEKECFDRLIEVTAYFFRTASTEYISLYEGAEALLQELKRKGKRVILLSNAQRLFTEHEIKALGIDTYFDKIYLSSDHKVKKPDQTFFELPYKEFKLDKKKTIMIGNDQTTDIAGAKKFGFDTCYLHSNISPEVKEPVKGTFVQNPIDLTSLNKILMI